MARLDYFAIECAIGEILRKDEAIAEEGIEILVEQELSMHRERQIILYLDSREAPADRQGLNAGTRTRMLVKFSVACYAFHLNIERSMQLRDDLMGRAEIVLMGNRTFDRTDVITSWLEGGQFLNAKAGGAGFMAMGEIGLIVDVQAISS